ncbi:MAG: hypothetical protein ACI915_002278 [Gammaproteobacteria bacterium]|jgi:hypothetical protein
MSWRMVASHSRLAQAIERTISGYCTDRESELFKRFHHGPDPQTSAHRDIGHRAAYKN